MKTLFLTLMLSLALFGQASGSSETVTIDLSKVSPELRKQIEVQQAKNQVKDNMSWAAGMGHEIGTAVNESLAAVSAEAQKLADSRLGYFLMGLLAFKIIGGPAFHLLGGFILYTVSMACLIWSYRRTCVSHNVKVSDISEPVEGFRLRRRTRQYQVIDNEGYDITERRLGHAVLAVIVTVISIAVAFMGW